MVQILERLAKIEIKLKFLIIAVVGHMSVDVLPPVSAKVLNTLNFLFMHG